MSLNDPIADMLTRIRNACASKHRRVDMPLSKMKIEIARILKENHYVQDYRVVDTEDGKQLLRVVSHTPVETEGLESMRTGGGWSDLMRLHTPPPEKIYTWWSYRARDWEASDRGRRLDHVWASPNLAPALTGMTVLKEARGWDRPSDHVPVIARLSLD